MDKPINLIQPLLYSALSNNLDNYLCLNEPARMDFYEFHLSKDDNHTFSFIPSPYCEWIIGYNDHAENAFFLCLGSTSKLTTIKLDHFEHYFGIRFDDNVCYINNSASNTATSAGLRDKSFVYTPKNDSFEYKLIKDLAITANFSNKVLLVKSFLKTSKKLCIIPENINKIFSDLKASSGSMTVFDLAERSGYSNRHICRMFTKQFGYGPKDYCKYIRFQKALNEILVNPHRGNSEFIQNIGYSDQAHFQREFKLFLGMTPKQYISSLQF